MPANVGTFVFTAQVLDQLKQSDVRKFTITVRTSAPPLVFLTTSPLPEATVGSLYSMNVVVSGGVSPYLLSTNGTLPPGLSLSASGVLRGVPTTAGTFGFPVQVVDQVKQSAVRDFAITVNTVSPPPPPPTNPPPVPVPSGDGEAATPPQSLRFQAVGLPDAATPEQQLHFGIDLSRPSSQAMTGTITLGFASDAINPSDDPAVQFSTGGRSVNFDVPLDARSVRFPIPQIAVMTGTVSGIISLKLDLHNGVAPSVLQQIRVDRLAPQILRVTVNPTDTGFEVRVLGYSTPREIRGAVFSFKAAAGEISVRPM
jgi:hypothetical protein